MPYLNLISLQVEFLSLGTGATLITCLKDKACLGNCKNYYKIIINSAGAYRLERTLNRVLEILKSGWRGSGGGCLSFPSWAFEVQELARVLQVVVAMNREGRAGYSTLSGEV